MIAVIRRGPKIAKVAMARKLAVIFMLRCARILVMLTWYQELTGESSKLWMALRKTARH
jgi:hypothetical protein